MPYNESVPFHTWSLIRFSANTIDFWSKVENLLVLNLGVDWLVLRTISEAFSNKEPISNPVLSLIRRNTLVLRMVSNDV